jgi:hypothetical protein
MNALCHCPLTSRITHQSVEYTKFCVTSTTTGALRNSIDASDPSMGLTDLPEIDILKQRLLNSHQLIVYLVSAGSPRKP